MRRRPLVPGDVLLARLPQLTPPGSEQSGTRPVLVVALPNRLGVPRYPMVIAAPMTTQLGGWVIGSPDLYPVLHAGVGGLIRASVVMLDHLRGVDAYRILKPLGTLSEGEYAPIRERLERIFGFGAKVPNSSDG